MDEVTYAEIATMLVYVHFDQFHLVEEVDEYYGTRPGELAWFHHEAHPGVILAHVIGSTGVIRRVSDHTHVLDSEVVIGETLPINQTPNSASLDCLKEILAFYLAFRKRQHFNYVDPSAFTTATITSPPDRLIGLDPFEYIKQGIRYPDSDVIYPIFDSEQQELFDAWLQGCLNCAAKRLDCDFNSQEFDRVGNPRNSFDERRLSKCYDFYYLRN